MPGSLILKRAPIGQASRLASPRARGRGRDPNLECALRTLAAERQLDRSMVSSNGPTISACGLCCGVGRIFVGIVNDHSPI